MTVAEITSEEDQKLLEIEGTDPRYWDPKTLTDDRLSGVVARLDDDRLSRMKEIANLLKPINRPYTAVLSAISGGDGKLDMTDWHCGTTHCLGGWIVTLAENGRALERRFGTQSAATLILRKSRPDAPLPNFFVSNQAAMAFIKARAAEEN